MLSPQDSPLFGSSLLRHTDVADEAVHGFLVVSGDGDVFSVYWFSSFWCITLVSIFSIAQPYVPPMLGPSPRLSLFPAGDQAHSAIVSRLVELFPVGWEGN